MAKRNKKKARINNNVISGKHARSFLQEADEEFIWAMQSNITDWEHSYYGFTDDVIKTFMQEIKPKLDSYCSMKWKEVCQKEHCHPWDMDNKRISKDLRNRLIELHKNKTPETLFQINLNGIHRIWGYKKDSIFYILFNDPEHRGCITQKNNT